MWEKHCPVILPLFLQVILLCFCLFHFVAFLAVTLFGGLGKEKIKKAIFPDNLVIHHNSLNINHQLTAENRKIAYQPT
jgi:hypothetical protein